MNIIQKGYCTDCGKQIPMVLKNSEYIGCGNAMWFRYYCKDCDQHLHPRQADKVNGNKTHQIALYTSRELLRTLDDYSQLLQKHGIFPFA